MEIVTVLFIAVGLAMDVFAVSLGIGASRRANTPRCIFRLAFHFGFFQGMMTLLGYLAGSTIAPLIEQVDHWIALVLLAWVGTTMIRSGLSADAETYMCDPSRGRMMVGLCVATSIDAMAVGISTAVLKTPIVAPSFIIAVVTFTLALFGLLAGHRLGKRFGKRMEVVGGLILNVIGIRVLLSHLL